jgi:membrane protease YdiL (CAAX protease family)
MTPAKTSGKIKPWARTLLILPAFIFVFALFQLFGYLVLGLHTSDIHLQKTPLQETVVALFNLIGTFTVIGIFRRFIDKERFRSMGFYPKGFRKEVILGLGLGALIMATGFASLVFLNEIQWTGTNVVQGNILLGICFFVFVAFSEELFLRGYILNNLMKSTHRMVALLISSVFFSLLHILNPDFSWFSFLNILLAGIFLGLPYIYTKSLWLPIALHFSWNFFQGTIFGFNVSGQVTYSLFTQSRVTDNFWNGGKFGFEGSALSVIFQLVAIFGLWWYYSKKEENSIKEEAASLLLERTSSDD